VAGLVLVAIRASSEKTGRLWCQVEACKSLVDKDFSANHLLVLHSLMNEIRFIKKWNLALDVMLLITISIAVSPR